MRLDVPTQARSEFIDITANVSKAVQANGANAGVAIVYCPHTTAGVTVNEHADPAVARDIIGWLDRVCPRDANWSHTEGNADGHVKAAIIGSSVAVPISDGRLQLGTWQGIFFCEFDGPRSRHVEVRVVAEQG